MKLLRLALVCSLLLLAAVPSFALACRACTGSVYPYCEPAPNEGTRCDIGVDTCRTVPAPNCSGFAPEAETAVLAEWTVASIEITRPAEGTKVVISPNAVADARISETAPQK